MSTTTVAVLAGPCSSSGSTAPARTSHPPVGARQAGDHATAGASRPRCTRAEPLGRARRRRRGGPRRAGRRPRRGRRAAGRACRRGGRRRPGSCGRPRRPSSAASPAATVVRPGAPAGPHTDHDPATAAGRGRRAGRHAAPAAARGGTSIGARRPPRVGSRPDGPRRRVRRCRAGAAVGQRVEVALGHQGGMPSREAAHRARAGGAGRVAGRDGDRPHPVARAGGRPPRRRGRGRPGRPPRRRPGRRPRWRAGRRRRRSA